MKLDDLFLALQPFKKKEKTVQLYTGWGSNICSDRLLTEYPRPQLVRNHYRSLNGWWKYAFAKRKRPETYEGRILVPFSPESVLSGVQRTLQPDEYLWYERSLNFDTLPSDRQCILHFEAVDQRCHVWVNGKKVITHSGGYLPFEVNITDALRQGRNRLTVCVQDVSDSSYHTRGKQRLHNGGIFYTAQSGIWQPVWYEWVPGAYIQDILAIPDIDRNTVTIRFWMNGADSKETEAELIVYKAGVPVSQGRFPYPAGDEGVRELTLQIPEPLLWTPENPELYDIVLRYGEDQVKSYFAMRKFSVEQDENGISRFCLNHRVYFMNGVLDQGYWPDGLMTAPSDEALVFDITKMKELGFNTIRKHCKIERRRFYYHCDRLGMLVWQDMVNGGDTYHPERICYFPTLFPQIAARMKDNRYYMTSRSHKKGREEWKQECAMTVRLLQNTVSLAVWVVFNEGWGQFDAGKAVDQIRELDSMRLIDQASGWFDQGGGDFASKHEYFRKLSVKPEKRASVISEFGGYACYIKDHSFSTQIYGYKQFGDVKSFAEAFRKVYEEQIRKLVQEGLCGCIFTQLSDVEEEVNGLLTYDRKLCKLV